MHIRERGRLAAVLTHRCKDRKDNRRENRYDCDHGEELNQRETAAPSYMSESGRLSKHITLPLVPEQSAALRRYLPKLRGGLSAHGGNAGNVRSIIQELLNSNCFGRTACEKYYDSIPWHM